jgi:DNA-binding Lrp family transcriptional regulator
MTELLARDSVAIDRLDQQLVRALQLGPRAAFSAIAAELGVSEQTVARRYRRLRRGGVLRVIGMVDPRALGQQDWVLRVRCRPDGASQLGLALARREDVAWVTISAAGSEVVCALHARSQAERDDLLVERLPQTTAVLGIAAAVVLHRFAGGGASEWVGLRDALSPTQVKRLSARPAAAVGEPASLEPADHVLLDLLARDGRTSYALLARASGMSEGRVIRRLEALQSSGALYFGVDLAAGTLGYPTSAYLWLSVAPAQLQATGIALAEHPEVPFAAAISGPANLVASVTCRSLADLYAYVTSKLGALAGVQSLEISPVLRRIKQAGALVEGDRLAPPDPPRSREPTSRRAGR